MNSPSGRQIITSERREAVRKLLEQLPGKDQELLRRLLEGQDRDVVSKALGVDRDTLRVLVHRALKRYKALEVQAQSGTQSRSDAVLAHALETFGSKEKSDHWLHRPNHVFQGKTPLEMIETDPEQVEIELTRIDHGVYI